jgi:hypothetical protein
MALLKQTWQSDTATINKPNFKIGMDKDGNEVIMTNYLVHTIKMGDVEDPDLFVAEPIWKWQQTEAGQWIMENAIDRPSWHRHIDHTSYGYIYAIRADLTPEQLTYYKLKFE